MKGNSACGTVGGWAGGCASGRHSTAMTSATLQGAHLGKVWVDARHLGDLDCPVGGKLEAAQRNAPVYLQTKGQGLAGIRGGM